MKKFLTLTLLGLTLVWGTAQADDKAQGSQQNKMGMCNKEAGEKSLKGDERKAFMSQCLSNKPAPAAPAKPETQQERMKYCNAEAKTKDLKGDERKGFMSQCLKK